MQIIAVDTSRRSLSLLVKCLKAVYPQSTITPFTDPMGAVKFGFNHKIDLVFTEIPMRGVDGFTLARLIEKHNEAMTVYFVTETMNYVNEALQMDVGGYLCKSITVEKLQTALGLSPDRKGEGTTE